MNVECWTFCVRPIRSSDFGFNHTRDWHHKQLSLFVVRCDIPEMR